jgi:hypothetical protein
MKTAEYFKDYIELETRSLRFKMGNELKRLNESIRKEFSQKLKSNQI